jgi:antitoxin CptB
VPNVDELMTDPKFTPEFLNKLRWRCRRGMQELDLLLLAYLERYFETAEHALQQAFLDVLAMQDPDIFHLLTGRNTSDDVNVQAVIQVLLTLHSK